MPGPCAYAGGNPTKGSGIELYGLSKREKQPNDIREVPGITLQVQESGILVPGILCGHGGEKCKENRRIHPPPVRRG